MYESWKCPVDETHPRVTVPKGGWPPSCSSCGVDLIRHDEVPIRYAVKQHQRGKIKGRYYIVRLTGHGTFGQQLIRDLTRSDVYMVYWALREMYNLGIKSVHNKLLDKLDGIFEQLTGIGIHEDC
jgi:hypothetical protein